MPPFDYTAAQVDQVVALISKERFAPYLRDASNDRAAALRLYERNTLLSESLYGLLQHVEVALRNSMHSVLSQGLHAVDWYDKAGLIAPETGKVSEARQRILDSQKSLTPDQIVAHLSFGFWVALTSKKYTRSLWVPHLYRAFPARRMSQQDANQRLRTLRDLRNRVAHHEPVYRRSLQSDLEVILETLRWMNPHLADWVEATNTLTARLR